MDVSTLLIIVFIIIIVIIGILLVTVFLYAKEFGEDFFTSLLKMFTSPFEILGGAFGGLTTFDWGGLGHTINQPFRNLWQFDWGGLGHTLNRPFYDFWNWSTTGLTPPAVVTEGSGVLALYVTDMEGVAVGMANVRVTNVSIGVGQRRNYYKITYPNGRMRLILPADIYTVTATKTTLSGRSFTATDEVEIVGGKDTYITIQGEWIESGGGGGGGGMPPEDIPRMI